MDRILTVNESYLQWNAFCDRYRISENAVSLFLTDDLDRVVSNQSDNHGRVVLQVSPAMRELLIRTVEQVLAGDWHGLLYMMLWKDAPASVTPLYIGRANKFGSKGQISANLRHIRTNVGFFARWGTSRDYHIGELSAACCQGDLSKPIKRHYRLWAARLFNDDLPSANPTMSRPAYFWAMPWGTSCQSVRLDLNSNPLVSEERSLISVASALFPDVLLNIQGSGKRFAPEKHVTSRAT
jgi:hypothetical protein